MDKFAGAVVRHRRVVLIIFAAMTLICALLMGLIKVNYNVVDYLPEDAQSTVALEIMNEEFAGGLPNASVMVRDVSIQEALEYKNRLSEINGVTEVLWLDDVMDIKIPLEMGNADTIESYYKNGAALFSVTIEKGFEQEAGAAIRELIGEGGAFAGEAADSEFMQQATGSESMGAMAIAIPLIILILILATESWIEPLLFLAAIGVSVVINMGFSAFMDDISFVTSSVTPILQLAVSLDYAIFLLHSFADNRKSCPDVGEAMRRAVKESFSSVAASASTTLFGFMALLFMEFQIGADLGLSLAKGIVFSFVSVMVFLPALTLSVYRLIDKTKHRAFMPSFKNVNGILSKVRIPALILVLIIIVPCFLGQSQTNFIYGLEPPLSSRSGQDKAAVKEVFGLSTAIALLVPRGDIAREEALCRDIEDLAHITGVVAYANYVGAAIPQEFLDESVLGQFYSENYARIVIYTDTAYEGDTAFAVVEAVHDAAAVYYGDAYYSAGRSVNLYDMKNVVQQDNSLTNLLAIVAIFSVLLVTFKSALLPVFLLLTIETAIWINLAIPYFTGSSINYVGYLIVNTVQLGATVDYAILLTVNYTRNRKLMPKKEAIHRTLGESFKPILISATTLTMAGFTLSATSSNAIVSNLGMLLARGTLLSLLMVLLCLPALLTAFDKWIGKTTYKANFFDERKREDDDNEAEII